MKISRFLKSALFAFAAVTCTFSTGAALVATDELTLIERNNGYQQGQIGRTADRFGNADGAFLFDGVNDAITLTGNTMAASFTFGLHFRVDPSSPDGAHIFDLGAHRFIDNNGRLFMSVNDPEWFGLSRISSTPPDFDIEQNIIVPRPDDGLWHHVAITFDAQSRRLQAFFDEALIWDFNTLFEGPNEWGILQTWELGRNTHDIIPSYFAGAMSHVFFDDRVLSADEIGYLAGGGVFPRSTPSDPNGIPEPSSLVLMAGFLLLMATRRSTWKIGRKA